MYLKIFLSMQIHEYSQVLSLRLTLTTDTKWPGVVGGVGVCVCVWARKRGLGLDWLENVNVWIFSSMLRKLYRAITVGLFPDDFISSGSTKEKKKRGEMVFSGTDWADCFTFHLWRSKLSETEKSQSERVLELLQMTHFYEAGCFLLSQDLFQDPLFLHNDSVNINSIGFWRFEAFREGVRVTKIHSATPLQ